jgi:hypothetical protein
VTIDLNLWHRAIHQVTGAMALRFNGATPADLERWARMLREVAVGMEAVAGPKADEPENYLRNRTLLIRSMRDVDFFYQSGRAAKLR